MLPPSDATAPDRLVRWDRPAEPVRALRPCSLCPDGSTRETEATFAVEVRGTGWYLPVKHGLDFVLALVLLTLSAPVIFLAALIVRLTSPGPAFYSQTRLGRNGRPYRIHKIRTMIHNAERASGPKWASPQDPRITRVGWFLRRTHIDELPQLWNVLVGDMSLVGPRPERPEFVPHLEQAIPGYRNRLMVRPGVTGLAQVQLPADTDLTSVRRKLAHDLYYVQRCGPWMDLRILICTACYLVGIPFAASGKVLGLPAGEPVQRAYEQAWTPRPNSLPQMEPTPV